MHVVPFFGRSIIDDLDTWMDDVLWDGPTGYSLFPARGRGTRQAIARNWTSTVNLTGFRKDDVNITRSEDGSRVLVHARRGKSDENYSEVRRCVQLPEEVDRDKVEMDFTREGVLVVKAPYKESVIQQQQQQQQLQLANQSAAMWPFGFSGWGNLSTEMKNLQDEVNKLVTQSFPGSINPVRYVKREKDGQYGIEMDFNVQGYQPDEIKVNLDEKKNSVTVEAKHSQDTEGGHSYKHMRREFTLPKGVTCKEMTSKLTEDGKLRLEAPCTIKDAPKPLPLKDTEIPINRK